MVDSLQACYVWTLLYRHESLDITLQACYVWTLLYRHVTFGHYFTGMLRLDITLQACYVWNLFFIGNVLARNFCARFRQRLNRVTSINRTQISAVIKGEKLHFHWLSFQNLVANLCLYKFLI
jgi:hypothetical protein